MRASVILLTLLLAGSPNFSEASGRLTSSESTPGLQADDLAAIQRLHQEALHHFKPASDGSHLAANPGLGWQMRFDGTGYLVHPRHGDWKWGLELQAINGRAVESGTASGQHQRLTVQRGAGLEEWFVNDQRGLEQGWTLSSRPEATKGVVSLKLAVRGGLVPIVRAANVTFVDDRGVSRVSYEGLKAWDAAGKALEARFVRDGADGFAVQVNDSDASYPITIDPLAQQAYLKASNAEANDFMGRSISISGNTVVVGAPAESSNATGVNGNQSNNLSGFSGAAYVFVRIGGVWYQQAYLKASNTGNNDSFGSAVAIDEDTLVVGAYGESSSARGVNGNQADDGSASSGAAYVFVRSGGVWAQQAYLKASNSDMGDGFGNSVAIHGNTVVVSAPFEASSAVGVNGNQADNSATSAGAAYVFVRSGTRWSQQAYLKASNTSADDQFGVSLAISGDTLVVGANQEDDLASNSGAAYVFVRKGSKWSQQAQLKASNAGMDDSFGSGVAVSGDTVIVGAYGEDSNAMGINGNEGDNSQSSAGAAYVFLRSGSSWSQQAYLKASNTATDDYFGNRIAISGDVAVISAQGEDSNATGVDGNQADNTAATSGAAYLFRRAGTTWTQAGYFKASNTGTGDAFGSDVSMSGDTMVIAAYGEASAATGVNGNQADNTASNSGAAYVFRIGEALNSVNKSGDAAAGATDLAFGAPGFGTINPSGQLLFDTALQGAGAAGGRNRAMFSTVAGSFDIALQKGTDLSSLTGLAPGVRVASLLSPINNRAASSAVFQATISGPGVSASNNRLLLIDTPSYLTLVARTGVPLAALGGAMPSAYREVFEREGAFDQLAISYSLRQGVAGVNATNDSGLMLMSHTGALTSVVTREGAASFGAAGGTFGQFGKATITNGGFVSFLAKWIPPSGTPVDTLYYTGSLNGKNVVAQGVTPGGTSAGEKFSSFPGLTRVSSLGLVRATLASGAASMNEGLWNESNVMLLRKGLPIDVDGHYISRFVRVWGINGSGAILVHAIIGGPGTNSTNNQVLYLRQTDGVMFPLLRMGSPAPGIGYSKATVGAFQAIDVNPINGHYAVVASLRGVPSSANQALWSGQVTLGDNAALQHLRLPVMRVQKGDRYETEATPLGTIKGISLTPPVDASGMGSRGFGQVINSLGQILFTITGDRGVKEQVVLSL